MFDNADAYIMLFIHIILCHYSTDVQNIWLIHMEELENQMDMNEKVSGGNA